MNKTPTLRPPGFTPLDVLRKLRGRAKRQAVDTNARLKMRERTLKAYQEHGRVREALRALRAEDGTLVPYSTAKAWIREAGLMHVRGRRRGERRPEIANAAMAVIEARDGGVAPALEQAAALVGCAASSIRRAVRDLETGWLEQQLAELNEQDGLPRGQGEA